MDKGLTVPILVLIVKSKIPQMSQKLSAQLVCPSPEVWDFNEKRLQWASVVRGSVDTQARLGSPRSHCKEEAQTRKQLTEQKRMQNMQFEKEKFKAKSKNFVRWVFQIKQMLSVKFQGYDQRLSRGILFSPGLFQIQTIFGHSRIPSLQLREHSHMTSD